MKIKEFQDWMIPALCEHLEEGCSFGSFAGRYNILPIKWAQWAKENPQLRMANELYKIKKNNERRMFETDYRP